MFETSTVKLAKSGKHYQVIAPHKGYAVYARFINPDGTMDAPVKLFDTGSKYVCVEAVAIPGGDDVFIAWSRSDDFIESGVPNWEIRGRVLTAR